MIKTQEQYDLLKELIEDNNNPTLAPQGEGFLTEELVHFVEGLIESYEEKAINNIA